MSPVDVVEAAIAGDTEDVPGGYTANALIHRPEETPITDICTRLISVFEPVNVLGIAIKRDPSYYIRLCEQHDRLDPDRLAVIDVNPVDSEPRTDVKIETVSDSNDLTGIGISATQLVKQAAGSEEPTVVCFDSLTPLLQYSEIQRCYKFLDVTTSRLSKVCAVSHAHLNPRAHDAQTVEQLSTVFDTVIKYDDGEWVVRPA